MTTSYSLLGDYEKAREHWAEVLKLYPDASLKWVSSFHFFKDPDQLERLLDVLRAVGIE
jgi:tetratricopeptide (TPR) repeat protein